MSGIGVKRNIPKALNFYREGEKQNNGYCLFLLGNAYVNGFGVDKDSLKAIEYYQKSAELGEANSEYQLERCYYNGIGGLPQDATEACRWYKKSAEQLNSSGQMYWAIALLTGMVQKRTKKKD